LFNIGPPFSEGVEEAEENKRPDDPVRKDLSCRNMLQRFPIKGEDPPGDIGGNGIPHADQALSFLNIQWNFPKKNLSNELS
jgi:hypothetical protein